MSGIIVDQPPQDDHGEDEIIVIDSQDSRLASGAQATTSLPRPIPARRSPRAGTAAAPQAETAGNGEETEVIDLTGSPEVEIIHSTVRPAPRPLKRARISPSKQVFFAAAAAHAAAAARAAAAAPPQPSSPRGPKCGICLEAMGGDSGRQMWAGSCGHIYCMPCLTAAIKATKKCPTCRKTLQQRQLHQVFLNF